MIETRVAFLLAGALLLLPGSTALAGDPVEWETEVGFLSGYHDNYFYKETGKPSEWILSVYGAGKATFDLGPGDLVVNAGATGAFGLEIDDTDYQVAHGGVGYKQGGTRGSLDYTRTFNKVYGEEDDASLYDVNSGRIRLRQEITESLRVQGSFQVQNWDFDSPNKDRNGFRYRPKGLVRWQAWDSLAFRGAFFWTFKEAKAGRFEFEGPGLSVAAEIHPIEPLHVFVRYRRRWRDYDNASPGDSNFEREDTIDGVLVNARLMLTDIFGVQLNGTYRHGDSNRPDRNYDAASVTGGFMFKFDGGG